jgi:3'-5' exoribonuclease
MTDLKRSEPGVHLRGPMLVVELDHRSYGDGKDCIVLTLANATGRIPSAPFWGDRRALVAGLSPGAPVEAQGEIRLFRGRRQLEVLAIRPLSPDAVDWGGLLPSVKDVGPYWRLLDCWRGAIRAPRLRSVLALFYDDPDFRHRYGACPASTSGHHAQLGGLLRHTCEVASIGRSIAAACGADRDLVTAGALMHDIGKLDAYAWDTGFTTTEPGALLGHVTLGMLMLERRTAALGALLGRESWILQHLIASHHGRLEFGAPIGPMTLEAEVLHLADNASARAASMVEALGDDDNFHGDEPLSVRGIWQLDRRKAYRGRSDWGAETCGTRK